MKISDVLRKIADAVDSSEEQQVRDQEAQVAAHQQEIEQAKSDAQDLQAGQVAQVVQAANNIKRAAEISADQEAMNQSLEAPSPNTHELTPADNTDNTDQDMMIAPLQQKHELLKKATDTSNDVDKFDDGTNDHLDDELAMLKQMAGIGQNSAASDEYGSGNDVEINPRKNASALIQLVSDEFDT
jgi:hypothetical protein